MTKTVIINRPLSESEIEEIQQLAESGSPIFTFSGNNVPDFAQRIVTSPEEKKEINYSMMSEVLRFGDLPVGNQSVAKLFSIDTASVWHYHKFRVYFAVRNLMYFLKPLQQKFDTFEEHCWFVNRDVRPLKTLFSEVDFRFPELETEPPLNFRILFSYLVLLKIRFLSYLFSSKKKPEYLLYLTEKYSTVMDKKTLKTKQGHHIPDCRT